VAAMARFVVTKPNGTEETYEGEYRIRGGSLAIHPTTEERSVLSPSGWVRVMVLKGDFHNLFSSSAR
jgi:hypothetical protein